MNIDTRVQDNRLFSGIKFYDSLPLTSRDLHEMEDAASTKMKHLLNNIIGNGVIGTEDYRCSSSGIVYGLSADPDPITLVIDGDITLIKPEPQRPVYRSGYSIIDNTTTSYQVLAIFCKYTPILADSDIPAYGYVRNKALENDLLDPAFNVQTTTRYQLRSAFVLIPSTAFKDVDTSSISAVESTIYNATAATSVLTPTCILDGSTFIGDINTIYSMTTIPQYSRLPSGFGFKSNDDNEVYMFPVCVVNYNNGYNDCRTLLPVMPKGSSLFLKQNTEPTGTYTEGTIWYNPDTKKFKTYISGEGFVENSPDMYIKDEVLINLQGYQYETVQGSCSFAILNLSKFTSIPVNPKYLFSVDGIPLVEGLHYTLDSAVWEESADSATGLRLDLTFTLLDFPDGNYDIVVRCQTVEKA